MKKNRTPFFILTLFFTMLLTACLGHGKENGIDSIPKKYLLQGEYLSSVDDFRYYTIEGSDNEVAVSLASDAENKTYTIPETVTIKGTTYQVTGIWRGGFANKTDLDITFPKGLKTIDYEAFFNTTFKEGKKDISLPYTLEGLGCAAFYHTDIESLTFLDGETEDTGVCPTGEETLVETTNITTSKLETIYDFAFARCEKLKTVTFSSSLKTIREQAFEHCRSLTNLAFLSGLTSIGSRAFTCCYNLKKVYLPNALFQNTSTSTIGQFAFSYCSNDLDLQVSYDGNLPQNFDTLNLNWKRKSDYKTDTYKVSPVKGDMYIENVWLYQDDGTEVRIQKYLGDPVENIAFPETIRNHKVTTIDTGCFSLLTSKANVKRIFLPKTLKVIPDEFFDKDFSNLTYIGALQGNNCYTIPNEDNIIDLSRLKGLITIGKDAFNANRNRFYTLNLPGNLEKIEKQAFLDLKYISTLTTQTRTNPNTLTIGEKAFFQLGSKVQDPKVDLVLPKETINISNNAFAGSACLKTLTIEGGTTNSLTISKNVFAGCINLDKAIIEDRTGTITIRDNAFGLSMNDNDSPVDYSYSPNLQLVYLPENTKVSASAFLRQLRATIYIGGNKDYKPDPSFLEQIEDKNNGNTIDYLHTTSSTLFGFTLTPQVYTDVGLSLSNNRKYLIYDQELNTSTTTSNCTYLLYEEDNQKKAILTKYRFNMLEKTDGTELEVNIPSTIDYLGNTYTVTEIGDYAFSCMDGYQNSTYRTIRKVTLPDTIEKIGHYAFFRMAGLEEINMPSSLKTIGELAFAFTGIKEIQNLNSDTDFLKKEDNTSLLTDFTKPSPFLNCPNLKHISLTQKTNSRLTSDEKTLRDTSGNILTVYPGFEGNDKNFSSTRFHFGAYKGVNWIQNLTISASDFPTTSNQQIPQSLFVGFNSPDDIRKNLTFKGRMTTILDTTHLTPLKVLTLKTDSKGNLTFPDNSFLNTSFSIIRIPYSYNGTIPSYFLKGITSSTTPLIFQVQQGKDGQYNNGGDEAPTDITKATSGLLDFGDNSGYQKIDKNAFQNIPNLQNLILPSTLKEVGEYAFNKCTNLTKVTFKGTDIKLGSHSFSENNLKEIHTIRNGTDIKDLLDTKSIGFAAFYNDQKLSKIIIGKNVTSSGERAFKGCIMLSDISFEETDTPLTINKNAFEKCFARTEGSIDFSRRPVILQDQAFLNCVKLTKVIFGDKNAVIGTQAFQSCTGLIEADFGKGVSTIQKGAFYKCGLLKADLSKCVNLTEVNGFSNCTKLGEVTFPINGNVTSIGEEAFNGCTSLTSIDIPSTVTTIKASAFKGCTSLSTIIIPDLVTTINTSLFEGCTSLKEVTLKGYITEIQDNAFLNCTSLTTIKTKTAQTEGIANLPDTVTTIGASAFKGCTSLTEIKLPDSLVTINDNAFMSSGLTTITLPSGLTYLGSNTFQDCKNLKTAILQGKNFTLKQNTFNNCPVLQSVIIKGSDNQGYEDSCFNNLPSLNLVILPDNFNYSIDTSIFNSCDALINGAVLIGKSDSKKNMGKWSYLKGSTSQVRYAYRKEPAKTYPDGTYLWDCDTGRTITLYRYTSDALTIIGTITLPE